MLKQQVVCVGVGMELDFADKEESSHFKWGGLRSP